MQVTTIDRYRTAPGVLRQWTVETDQPLCDSPIPPSFNQRFHIAASGDESTWLAASFDVPGPLNDTAMGMAYHDLIRRHATLQSSFSRCGEDIQRHVVDPTAIRLEQSAPMHFPDGAALREHLWETLNSECSPLARSAFVLAAIDRPGSSTVFCGFDHSHVDAYSISIIIDDLYSLYCQHAFGNPRPLAIANSFLTYCTEESQAPHSRDGVDQWVRFLREHGCGTPQFPLDLGVPDGQTVAQAVSVIPLLTAVETADFAARCRENGASTYAGILAAMAHSVAALGGQNQLPLVFPVHTRRDQRWADAVGWFIANAPVTVACGATFDHTLAATGEALRTAIDLASVSMADVLGALGGLQQRRRDVFMVSYVDYRHLPGADRHVDINAGHVSNVTRADDAQFWVSRTDRGLALRIRYPDTITAHQTIRGFVAGMTEYLCTPVAIPA